MFDGGGEPYQELSAAVKAWAVIGRTSPVHGTCALTVAPNLRICRKILPIHLNGHIMQKGSADLPDLKCYAETIYLFP